MKQHASDTYNANGLRLELFPSEIRAFELLSSVISAAEPTPAAHRRKGGGTDNQVGYDASKKVKGRKIHALVDSAGLPMRVVTHYAAIQDRDGAGPVLDKIRRRFPWLELLWVDGGYNAWQVEAAVAKVPVLRMEIVTRSDNVKGFVVLPRRWVIERTFSWFRRYRRLARDFETLAETLATFVYPGTPPTRRQAARQGIGRGSAKGWTPVVRHNPPDDPVAPIPVVRGTMAEPRASTLGRLSKSLRARVCHPFGKR
jgi:transposase